MAVTLESVAVYLAWQAHLALAADDSALRLRLAAYAFALVIGVMNYSPLHGGGVAADVRGGDVRADVGVVAVAVVGAFAAGVA